MRLISSLTCLMVLTACTASTGILTPAPLPPPNNLTNGVVTPTLGTVAPECMPTLQKFDFPYGGENSGPAIAAVIPPASWQEISRLPSYDSNDVSRQDSLELIRHLGGHDQIWIIVSKNSGGEYLRYETDTHQWLPAIPETQIAQPKFLFLDKNGAVWAAGSTATDSNPSRVILGRFDDAVNRFVPILSIDSLFPAVASEPKDVQITDIKVDDNGLIWLMVLDSTGGGYLYNFDPLTLKIDQVTSDQVYERSYTFEIAPNNSIFIVDLLRSMVMNYFPLTHTLMQYPIPAVPETTLSYGGLYYDHEDRLWIDDLGWFDESPGHNLRWFVLIRPPELIDYNALQGWWSYSTPEFTAEHPNNVLWFNSTRGTGWVDTKSGKWCVFTSYSSKVEQDYEGNLWIIANGMIYEFPSQT